MPEEQKKKPDDKGYNAAPARIPEYDPWQIVLPRRTRFR
jgi:hypothetical protein